MQTVRRIVGALLLLLAQVTMATTTVYFPAPETAGDSRLDYFYALLQLAVDKAHADYRIERTQHAMLQSRALAELAHGSARVHIVACMTSREREAQLLPIRIPIDKGLIGWRVPLVTSGRQDLLKNIGNAEDLTRFTAGQEGDWPDTAILRANYLPVVTATTYTSLFKMLSAGRFDYLPRSVLEILPEATRYRDDGIVVEPHLVLHYPAAIYYFVNRADERLAEVIRTGLEAAVADGSFERLFDAYHARAIEELDLAHRTVIALDNPLLPDDAPLQRRELWMQPGELRHK
jgi:hypothetical protein